MTNGRRFIVSMLLMMFVLTVCGRSVAAADGPKFSLQPSTPDSKSLGYFILDGQNGQTIQRTIRVGNTGDTVGTVRLIAVDATTGATSGIVYRSDTDPRTDVGAWITIDKAPITLNAGESRNVDFTIVMPASSRPGEHVGGIVAMDDETKTQSAGSGATVSIKTQTITAVQINIPGPTVERIGVTGVTGGGEGGHQTLLLGMRNNGTTMVAPAGSLVVMNARGDELQNLPFKLDKILPDTEIQYAVAVQTKALDAGDYKANVVLNYGQSGETRYNMPFTITPAQIEQVFPSTKPQIAGATQVAAPTLVAPASARGTAVPGALPNALQTAPIAPSLIIAGAIAGGVVLLMGAVGGGIVLGRRKRT